MLNVNGFNSPIKSKNYQTGFFCPADIRTNRQIHNCSVRFIYNPIRNRSNRKNIKAWNYHIWSNVVGKYASFQKHTDHVPKTKGPNSKFLQEFERIIIIFSDNAFTLKTNNKKIVKQT